VKRGAPFFAVSAAVPSAAGAGLSLLWLETMIEVSAAGTICTPTVLGGLFV